MMALLKHVNSGVKQMPTFEKPVSRSELARLLSIDRVTLWNWQRAGRIPAPERVARNRSEFSLAAQMAAAAIVEARTCA